MDEKRIHITKQDCQWNPAWLKLFDEVLSNSCDEATKNKNIDTIKIDVDESTGRISVFDNGGISVKIHPEHNQYIPEMIFTELLCGSNFDDADDSVTTGQNGIGVKLTNIFSTSFEITTCDGKKKFYQKCENNLSKKSKPKITTCSKNGTTISWIPDYARFKTELHGGNLEKLVKRVYDTAA